MAAVGEDNAVLQDLLERLEDLGPAVVSPVPSEEELATPVDGAAAQRVLHALLSALSCYGVCRAPLPSPPAPPASTATVLAEAVDSMLDVADADGLRALVAGAGAGGDGGGGEAGQGGGGGGGEDSAVRHCLSALAARLMLERLEHRRKRHRGEETEAQQQQLRQGSEEDALRNTLRTKLQRAVSQQQEGNAEVAAEGGGGEAVMAVEAGAGVVELADEQKAMLDVIAAAMRDDFTMRRIMLLKRCDVTVQSFLWGDKAAEHEADIVGQIEGHRKALSEKPVAISVQDAVSMAARSPEGMSFAGLVYEHTRRVSDESAKCVAKTVRIGAVPDRGGRTNEMRPSAGMPEWKKRGEGNYSQGGGRSGGRGGGRGGRSGGGGGGGRGGRGGGGWRRGKRGRGGGR